MSVAPPITNVVCWSPPLVPQVTPYKARLLKISAVPSDLLRLILIMKQSITQNVGLTLQGRRGNGILFKPVIQAACMCAALETQQSGYPLYDKIAIKLR